MLTGPFTRTRKNQKRYKKHMAKASGACDFCAFTAKSSQVIKEYPNFWLVTNIFGYDVWDSQGIKEHLLLVPKKHVKKLSQLSPNASKEYIKLIGQFEDKGYSSYTRSVENAALSVVHKHTHLIKLDDKRKKALLFIYKPHIVVYF
jgi:diadenosine tetraphosphate (Ap4A) HIT family hydrolase